MTELSDGERIPTIS